jgi:hypothetical protein
MADRGGRRASNKSIKATSSDKPDHMLEKSFFRKLKYDYP